MNIKLTILTGVFTILFFSTNAQEKIEDIISHSKEATINFSAIYDLDVISFFELEEKYNTELKKATFKKTEEYQNLLQELRDVKSEMLQTVFYYIDNTSLGEYDIKKGGFKYSLGANYVFNDFLTGSARNPKSLILENGETIFLKSLPSEKVFKNIYGNKVYDECIFFKVSEKEGLEIENDLENVSIYFFFTPSGRENSTFKFLNLVKPQPVWASRTRVEMKSDYVRIVIANKVTGKVYFDKLSPSTAKDMLLIYQNKLRVAQEKSANSGDIDLIEKSEAVLAASPTFNYDGYISQNLHYPNIAREKGIQGRVIVKFVVNEDGSVSNAEVVRGIGGGCDEECVKVVLGMPKWNPAIENGKAVKSSVSKPFIFKQE